MKLSPKYIGSHRGVLPRSSMGSEKRDLPGPAPRASVWVERTNLSQRAPTGIVATDG
jgi:hypothetical protein